MDNMIIENVIKRLRIEYFLIWIITILLVSAFEYDFINVGISATDENVKYILQVIGILLSLSLIPFALKLFTITKVKNKIMSGNEINGLAYLHFSELRLLFLAIPIVFNLISYYLTLESSNALCVLITLLSLLFCWPSKKRVVNETESSDL